MNNFCQIKPVEKLVPKVLKNLLSTYLLSNILSATNWPQQQQISARIFSTACLVGIHKPEKQPKHFLGNFSLASYRFDEGTLGWHLLLLITGFSKRNMLPLYFWKSWGSIIFYILQDIFSSSLTAASPKFKKVYSNY